MIRLYKTFLFLGSIKIKLQTKIQLNQFKINYQQIVDQVKRKISLMASYFLMVYLIIHASILNAFGHYLLRIHTYYVLFLMLKLKFQKQTKNYDIKLQKSSRLNICTVCDQTKMARYHHCRKCKKCIYRMDHHCDWIDNCIGQFNSKVYLHFLVNFAIQSLLTIINVLSRFSKLFHNNNNEVYLLVIFIPSLYGLYQSSRLLIDFYYSLKKNQTLIQSFQRVSGKQQTIQKTLTQIMGSQVSISWLIPISAGLDKCNLRQPVKRNQYSKQDKIYADEYLYGSDDQDQFQQSEQYLQQANHN